MSDVQKTLVKSQAGLRFIAQMTIFNSGDLDRLRTFVAHSYTKLALMQHPVERRLLDMKTSYRLNGRVRVREIVDSSEYHIILLADVEKSNRTFRVEMKVEEDYPHAIVYYAFQPVDETQES